MGYIGFEICEDGLSDPDYCRATYETAAQLCAELCREFDIAPEKPTLVCHSEGHALGIATAHADVMHWWPRHGLSMDGFRARVKEIMEEDEMTQERFDEMLAAGRRALAEKPQSAWSQAEGWWEKATALGLVDGSAPQGELTREQFIAVLGRMGLIGEGRQK